MTYLHKALCLAALSAALSSALSAAALAQDAAPVPTDPMPPVSRMVLDTQDVAGAGMQATFVLVDIAPNVTVERHTHPGAVAAYVVYGSIDVELDGEARRRFAAGEAFTVPANTVHEERAGAAGARILASFVVPAGAPLAAPAK
jgi:quercetin dioxygenase-like cupin family protein